MTDQENSGASGPGSVSKFKDLESFLEKIRELPGEGGPNLILGDPSLSMKMADLFATSVGKELFGFTAVFLGSLSKCGGNIEKFSSQIFNFVFSTRKEFQDKILDEEMDAETKFFACLSKYVILSVILGTKFQDEDFKSTVMEEIGSLTKFFETTVAPLYKEDKSSRRKILSLMMLSHELAKGEEGYTKSVAINNIIFSALRVGCSPGFLDTMLGSMPEFLWDDTISFQGSTLFNDLLLGSPHWKLAGKYLAANPKQIYLFCTTVDSNAHKYSGLEDGRGKSLFSDFAVLDKDFKISFYDTRCQPNFLSNLIGTTSNKALKANGAEASELLFHALEALNEFIDRNIADAAAMKDIGYHLNCPIVYREEGAITGMETPLEVLVRMAGEKRSTQETGILKKSLELLTSENIGLKTLGELRSETYSRERTELDSKLKSNLTELDGERSKQRPLKKIADSILDRVNAIFGTKFNTINRREKVIRSEINGNINKIRDREGEDKLKEEAKTKETRDLAEQITGKGRAKTTGEAEVEKKYNNLENRLDAGLERFNRENGETGKLSIVDIPEMNDREKEEKEKKEKEEKEKEKDKDKDKEKEKDTLDPFDDYPHNCEDKIETGARAETGGVGKTNDVSQSLIGVFTGCCSTSPEQQGASILSSNATQQANINTNTKETSF
ncbi:MAG: hypothetical protein LBU15_04355 [Rickettsiales bacterium]|nr:hypothetical protein [Rickettsiales bacterium]